MIRRRGVVVRGLRPAGALAVALAAGVGGTALLGGCGGGTRGPNAASGGGGDDACRALDPVLDAYASLQARAAYGASSDVGYLVDVDDHVAYLEVARAELAAAPSPRVAALVAQIDTLVDALEAQRDVVARALGAAAKTYDGAEAALDAAATCQHVDFRDRADAGDATERGGKAARSKASRSCESARRLWEAARDVDLTSEVSSSSIASQVGEIRLDGDRAKVRARLAAALDEHARALHGLHAVAAPTPDEQSADFRALAARIHDVGESLRATSRSCLDAMTDTGRVIGDGADARRVTVNVWPRWSGALADLPRDEQFGSGFVVRWRTLGGDVETRIVTNNHVMAGAFEADVVSGAAAGSGHDAAAKVPATLVQASPIDDVAVLKLAPGGAGAGFLEGVRFRFSAAREQEPVVAAGFPGVGAIPSFQVSRGAVSNARFGADGSDDESAISPYVQHTAPIDPGNSGGPLLDGDDRLLGMNTLKIVGRENVGLAIPTSRIEAALLRADRAPTLDIDHARASCNAIVAALSSSRPVADAMSRFGLALFESTASGQGSAAAAAYRGRVAGNPDNPVDVARWRAYGSVRAALEEEGGVRPYETCSGVAPAGDAGTMVGSFRTRARTHKVTLAAEHGAMRAVKVE